MNATRRTATVVLLLAFVAALWPAPAHAQFAVFDAINYAEQLIQYLQMLADYYQQYRNLVKQVEQLRTLIDQVERMDTNLLKFDELNVDSVGRWLGNLRTILYRLDGIVYVADDILARWDDLHRLDIPPDLAAAEGERRRSALETYRSLLAGVHEAANGSESAARRLNDLVDQLNDSEGNLQALQSGGALVSEVAAESARSAEVNAMTVNALAVQFGEEQAAREQAHITFEDWVSRGRYGSYQYTREFEPVPTPFRRSAP